MTDDPSQDQNRRKLAMLGEPPRLTLKVPFQVAWGSIRIRLSRSLVTLSSVVLAVAFLLVVTGGDLCTRAVHRGYAAEQQPLDDLGRVRDVLERVRPPLALLRRLDADRAATLAWAEAQGAGTIACPAEAVTGTMALATWIEHLNGIDRFKVLGTSELTGWLLALDPAKAQTLYDLQPTLRAEHLTMTRDALTALGGAMPQVAAAVAALQKAETSRRERVEAAGGASAVLALLARGASDAELTAAGLPFAQVIADADGRRRAALRHELETQPLRDRAARLVARVNKAFPRLNPLKPQDVTDPGLAAQGQAGLDELRRELGPAAEPVLQALRDQGSLDRLRAERQKAPPDAPVLPDPATSTGLRAGLLTLLLDEFSAAERQVLAGLTARQHRLNGLAESFLSLGFDPDASRERTFWLVLLSLLVCIVGIVNSMMMAVTERFVEIATMKCLGAMDSFIVKSFLIESGIIGGAGAVVGVIVGLAIAVAQAGVRFGESFWPTIPVAHLAVASGLALACGIVLTVAGALLPAWKAARMHPIEAMRLEA